MQINEIDVRTAQQRLGDPAGGCLYVDVRSVTEYEQGHVAGSWNLPLLHSSPSGMRPNPEFQPVAAASLPKDKLLLVGCKSGQRSFMACRILIDMGFDQVMNVEGGFFGSVDPMTGQMLAAGWVTCGLPSTKEPTPGRTWEELKAESARQPG